MIMMMAIPRKHVIALSEEIGEIHRSRKHVIVIVLIEELTSDNLVMVA